MLLFEQIIDAHIHLDLYDESERQEILASLNTERVDKLIAVSFHLESARKNLQYARDNERIEPAFGYHPEQPLPTDEELSGLLQFIDAHQQEMAAVGEVGLPCYLRQENNDINWPAYVDVLEVFIQKAAAVNKPIVLHAIYDDAPIDCDLLEKYSIRKAHFHWFKGDKQTLQRMKSNGYYISLTPDSTYETEIQEIARDYPLSLMMVETDGPWRFKGEFAEKTTHPKMIHQTIKSLATLKEVPIENVYRQLYVNTKEFYGMNKGCPGDDYTLYR